MNTERIETHVCELICTALAGLQHGGKIKEQDVQTLNYTTKGAEAIIEHLGHTYRLSIEPTQK